jgi:bisphosphoglycerate-dependent phosphoglycerate mutase
MAKSKLPATKVNRTGRPTVYSSELARNICQQIAEGKSLKTICATDDTPAVSTLFEWLNNNKEFSELYAQAKSQQADAFIEEMLVISDTESDVQRARLKIDTMKWVASKLKPKVYGDAKTVDVTVKSTHDEWVKETLKEARANTITLNEDNYSES